MLAVVKCHLTGKRGLVPHPVDRFAQKRRVRAGSKPTEPYVTCCWPFLHTYCTLHSYYIIIMTLFEGPESRHQLSTPQAPEPCVVRHLYSGLLNSQSASKEIQEEGKSTSQGSLWSEFLFLGHQRWWLLMWSCVRGCSLRITSSPLTGTLLFMF